MPNLGTLWFIGFSKNVGISNPMESASQRSWVHRKKQEKENHRKVSYPSTFIGKTKETKHPVKPHCIGFLCFSCTKPNTPSNKIPLFFTCIPIIFLFFLFLRFFDPTFQKGPQAAVTIASINSAHEFLFIQRLE